MGKPSNAELVRRLILNSSAEVENIETVEEFVTHATITELFGFLESISRDLTGVTQEEIRSVQVAIAALGTSLNRADVTAEERSAIRADIRKLITDMQVETNHDRWAKIFLIAIAGVVVVGTGYAGHKMLAQSRAEQS